MQCMEVWGGSQIASSGVELAGLDVWVYSGSHSAKLSVAATSTTSLVDCRKVTITSCYASKLVWRTDGSEVSLTSNQRSELSSIAQSRTLPAGYVFRAKLILMLAEGASFNTIKRRLQTSAPTIVRWKQRFLETGLDGLDT